jgi:parvulin-like peptidyl-prolyl isomerase
MARTHAQLALVLLAASARAQEEVKPTRPATATAPASRPRPDAREVVFDHVLATYKDFVVTESMIRDGLNNQLRAMGPEGANPRTREELQRKFVQTAISDEILAQAAKTIADPDTLEKELEKAWAREVKEKTTEAGGTTGLISRLQEMGLTWDQYQDVWRTSQLRDLYLSEEIFRKFGGEQTQVTPSEIRAYYKLHPEEFRRKESVDVEGVQISLAAEGAQAIAERALAALKEGKTVAEVVTASGGTALPPSTGTGIGPDSSHIPALKEFAAKHKKGDSGGPLRIGSSLWVLRVKDRVEAKDGRFDDPDVQSQIVNAIKRQRLKSYEQKILQEKLRQAYTWPEDLFLFR